MRYWKNKVAEVLEPPRPSVLEVIGRFEIASFTQKNADFLMGEKLRLLLTRNSVPRYNTKKQLRSNRSCSINVNNKSVRSR